MQKAPYLTTNFSQALALHVAGATILKVMNCYTPEDLSKLGFRTVKEAVAAGKQGTTYYFITPHERLQQLIGIYDEADAEETEGDIAPEDAIRLAKHVMKLRRDLQRLSHQLSASWLVKSKGHIDPSIEARIKEAESRGDEISFSFPGAVMMRGDATEETRKRLGL